MGRRKDSYFRHKNLKTKGLNLNRAKVKTFVRSILDGILDRDEFSATTSNIILDKGNLQSSSKKSHENNVKDSVMVDNVENSPVLISEKLTKDDFQHFKALPFRNLENLKDSNKENHLQVMSNIDLKNMTDRDIKDLKPSRKRRFAKTENYSELKLETRHIIDTQFFLEQLKELNNHAPQLGCSLNNLVVYGQIKNGLNSILQFHCQMCNSNFKIRTTESDIDVDAAHGAMSVGLGFWNTEELFSVLNLPFMSQTKYNKCHNQISDAWEQTASKQMAIAAKEEADYAKEIGDVDKNGVPLITVVADGCWSKRSYRSNYNALSGAATIIGHRFGKVLYLGVKNKFCSICLANKQIDHKCYKNYTGTSTGMESTILLEGFKHSEKLHGIIYAKLISDGDSSTYKKILEHKPYDNLTVEKIECRNHLLRNFSNKLKTLSLDTRFPIKFRKLLSQNILRFRTSVTKAISYRKNSTTNISSSQSILMLKKDIDNSVLHIFGQHSNCDKYFCNKNSDDTINVIPDLKSSPEFFIRLKQILHSLSDQSRSLLYDVDSNVVEQFHSIVAKFVGGKRVNYSKGRSYQCRCFAAVVSFNSKCGNSELKKTLGSNSSLLANKLERQRRLRAIKAKSNIRKKMVRATKTDFDYGENCSKPDLDKNIFDAKKEDFLKELPSSDSERSSIQEKTISQANSSLWLEVRRKMITASHFKAVCTRRSTTLSGPLVKRIIYESSPKAASISHGKKYEKVALLQLQEQENILIGECGIFIDREYPYLGATPDGIVGDDLVVEVKCPYSAYKMEVDDAIEKKKIPFWILDKKTGEYVVNIEHQWYYQIQGQLHITGRKACIFGVWTDHKYPLKVEYILKRNDFWRNKMEQKLKSFFMNCVLPELIDPRHARGMPLREPSYILEAIQNKTNNKKRTKKIKQN